MAILHHARLTPTKLELLGPWLPRQDWFPETDAAASAPLAQSAAFRFDDPAGRVGVETLIVRAGDGPLLQVPLSYRDTPLPGAEGRLIGTLEHSVLGTRWVYDGAGDPVYVSELARAILTGGTEVEQFYDTPHGLEPKPTAMRVRGSGRPGTPLPTGVDLDIDVVRVLDGATAVPGGALTLTGEWDGAETVLLATLSY